MKNLSLCFIFSSLFISCSAESDFISSDTLESSISTMIKDSTLSQYNQNPFDAKGKKYYDALTSYLQKNKDPNSIDELTNQIQFIALDYSPSVNTLHITPEEVRLIMDDPVNKLKEITGKSSMGLEAKEQLLVFMQNLISHQGDEFEKIYSYILSYETSVLNSTTLAVDDKEQILTVTSVSAYALNEESKRKDKDWETSVGNKSAKPFFSQNQISIISVIALYEAIN